MPEMDGYQVLEALAKDEPASRTPVIVVSGQDDEHSVQACIALGAKSHLAKPITRETLISAIDGCTNDGLNRD